MFKTHVTFKSVNSKFVHNINWHWYFSLRSVFFGSRCSLQVMWHHLLQNNYGWCLCQPCNILKTWHLKKAKNVTLTGHFSKTGMNWESRFRTRDFHSLQLPAPLPVAHSSKSVKVLKLSITDVPLQMFS